MLKFFINSENIQKKTNFSMRFSFFLAVDMLYSQCKEIGNSQKEY